MKLTAQHQHLISLKVLIWFLLLFASHLVSGQTYIRITKSDGLDAHYEDNTHSFAIKLKDGEIFKLTDSTGGKKYWVTHPQFNRNLRFPYDKNFVKLGKKLNIKAAIYKTNDSIHIKNKTTFIVYDVKTGNKIKAHNDAFPISSVTDSIRITFKDSPTELILIHAIPVYQEVKKDDNNWSEMKGQFKTINSTELEEKVNEYLSKNKLHISEENKNALITEIKTNTKNLEMPEIALIVAVTLIILAIFIYRKRLQALWNKVFRKSTQNTDNKNEGESPDPPNKSETQTETPKTNSNANDLVELNERIKKLEGKIEKLNSENNSVQVEVSKLLETFNAKIDSLPKQPSLAYFVKLEESTFNKIKNLRGFLETTSKEYIQKIDNKSTQVSDSGQKELSTTIQQLLNKRSGGIDPKIWAWSFELEIVADKQIIISDDLRKILENEGSVKELMIRLQSDGLGSFVSQTMILIEEMAKLSKFVDDSQKEAAQEIENEFKPFIQSFQRLIEKQLGWKIHYLSLFGDLPKSGDFASLSMQDQPLDPLYKDLSAKIEQGKVIQVVKYGFKDLNGYTTTSYISK